MTLTETICVTAVLSILVLMLLPMVAGRKRQLYRVKCVSNLNNIALSYRIWAHDHNELFPFQVSTNHGGTLELTNDVGTQFQVLSNELTVTKILLCPRDFRRKKEAADFSSIRPANVSYFVGIDATQNNPNSILLGDGGFTVNGWNPKAGLCRLTPTNRIVYPKKFHKQTDGATIALSDGSIQQIGANDLPFWLRKTGIVTTRFVLP